MLYGVLLVSWTEQKFTRIILLDIQYYENTIIIKMSDIFFTFFLYNNIFVTNNIFRRKLSCNI